LKALLTGATGNLGTALRETGTLALVPLARGDWPALPDLLAGGVDAVIHAAWDLKTPVTKNPSQVVEANLMTTMRLLEACRDRRVPRFAYVSTCAVYGESTHTAEDAPCHPVTVNGIAKLLNERVIEAFCAEHGIDCQVYRVFNMFGGNDAFSILSHLRRALERSAPFVLNNHGAAQRDFIHVRDVASIIATFVQKKLPAVHVNVGTGRATRVCDVVGVVRRLHPGLRIEHRSVAEAEYSRADTKRLFSLIDGIRFVDVMEFVESEFCIGAAPPGSGA
jgi:UDP-glucose 4-epimerase